MFELDGRYIHFMVRRSVEQVGAGPRHCEDAPAVRFSSDGVPDRGPGDGDPRLSPEGRRALTELLEGDDLWALFQEIGEEDPDLAFP